MREMGGKGGAAAVPIISRIFVEGDIDLVGRHLYLNLLRLLQLFCLPLQIFIFGIVSVWDVFAFVILIPTVDNRNLGICKLDWN